MADSRPIAVDIDAAIREGWGIAELISKRFPDHAGLVMLAPRASDGFFPATLTCRIFGVDFKEWNRRFSGRTNDGRRQFEFLNRVLLRLNAERAGTKVGNPHLATIGADSATCTTPSQLPPLTRSDIIKTAHGGGADRESWIHPRLLTHFLNWCCPEFAEEIINVFHSFVGGDPRLAVEQQAIRAGAHERELAANAGDVVRLAEVSAKYDAELATRDAVLNAALADLKILRTQSAADKAKYDADLETLKRDHQDKYTALLEKHKVEMEQMAMELEDTKDDLDDANYSLGIDTCRPLNYLAKFKDPLTKERHACPMFHYYAHQATCTIGTALSYHMYACFVDDVITWASILNKDEQRHQINKMLADPATFKKARKRVMGWYKTLDKNRKQRIVQNLRAGLVGAMEAIFHKGVIPDEEVVLLKSMYNPVDTRKLVYRAIKKGRPIDYSTEALVEVYVTMAKNFNRFADKHMIPITLTIPYDIQV